MTFSDKKVVEFIEANFVPVWESVAPVTKAVYQLDEDRSVEGILSGEIAVYFCRPDGMVFDILPGLYSPAATLAAMREAVQFYEQSNHGMETGRIAEYHQRKAVELPKPLTDSGSEDERAAEREATRVVESLEKKISAMERDLESLRSRSRTLKDAPDAATRDLRRARGKSVLSAAPREVANAMAAIAHGKDSPGEISMTVVAPGGKGYYRRFVHRLMGSEHELKAPAAWTETVFEDVLGTPLEHGAGLYENKGNWEQGLLIVE